jgi:hypothetical protein
MTAQEVFDQVATHLLTQGAKSTRLSICMYRGAAGRQCAVGCMIPDEEYEERMEGKTIIMLVGNGRLTHLKPHLRLLATLQSIHDNMAPVDWQDELAIVAPLFGLTFTPPEAT